MWRKVILPALLDGREWSNSGSAAWSTKAKIEVLATVLKVLSVLRITADAQGINPDWTHVAAAQGRTPTRELWMPASTDNAEVKDVWRKVMQPKLLKGETIS